MGQAFRRAAGRARTSGLDASSTSPLPPATPRPPPTPPPGNVSGRVDVFHKPNGEGNSSNKRSDGSEERDPKFDEMLNQMVGRITTKPGGKAEMGEAFVVENYNRPLPKLRSTLADSGRYEDRAAPPGTLKVAELRHIMLLHQGKADDHNGPMDVKHIAERFRLETAQVEKILQFVSLPPEEAIKNPTQGR